MRHTARALPLFALLALPEICFAQTLASWVGLFNIMVGIVLVAAFLFYGGGMVMWVVRRNTWPTNRDEAIHVLEWSVTILFVLIVLLAIVHFTQVHTDIVLIIIAIVIVFFVARLIAQSGGKGEEKHEEH